MTIRNDTAAVASPRCQTGTIDFIATLALSLVVLAGSSTTALAEETKGESDWRFRAGVYLWGASMGGKTVTGSDIDISVSDIFDNLDFGFMGSFEARKSKWGLIADVIYLDVSVDDGTDVTVPVGPGIPVSGRVNGEIDLTGWVLQFAGLRNVVRTEQGELDVVAGARYVDLDSDLTVNVAVLGGSGLFTESVGQSAWDGIIGFKGNISLSQDKKWFAPGYVDIGTGESDFTWQALGGIGYRTNWGSVLAIYRHIEWDFASGEPIAELDFSGPAVGVVFDF